MEKHKSIVTHGKQLYAKIDGEVKQVSFDEIKPNVIKDLCYLCESARVKCDPAYRCPIMKNPVEVPLTKKKLDMYKEASKFSRKARNHNIIKNSLESSVGEL